MSRKPDPERPRESSDPTTRQNMADIMLRVALALHSMPRSPETRFNPPRGDFGFRKDPSQWTPEERRQYEAEQAARQASERAEAQRRQRARLEGLLPKLGEQKKLARKVLSAYATAKAGKGGVVYVPSVEDTKKGLVEYWDSKAPKNRGYVEGWGMWAETPDGKLDILRKPPFHVSLEAEIGNAGISQVSILYNTYRERTGATYREQLDPDLLDLAARLQEHMGVPTNFASVSASVVQGPDYSLYGPGGSG